MELYEAIFYRKTTEKFSIKKVKQPMIEDIKRICANITYLNEDLTIKANVIDRGHLIHFLMGKECTVRAPHYIVLTSDRGEDYLENIGYAAENVVLNLTSLGIATCYMGSTLSEQDIDDILKDGESDDENDGDIDFFENIEKIEQLPYIIIAFGYPEPGEELFRSKSANIHRKDLKDMTKGFKGTDEWDEILSMVRRSPSVSNSQPWFFYREGEVLHLYEKIHKKYPIGLTKISVGIALKHFDISCKHFGVDVVYEKMEHKDRRGKEYFISIKKPCDILAYEEAAVDLDKE